MKHVNPIFPKSYKLEYGRIPWGPNIGLVELWSILVALVSNTGLDLTMDSEQVPSGIVFYAEFYQKWESGQ